MNYWANHQFTLCLCLIIHSTLEIHKVDNKIDPSIGFYNLKLFTIATKTLKKILTL